MCAALKVTKGSFYRHFQNTEGYVEALMKYWMEKNTVDFINSTEIITEINEKHDRFNELLQKHLKMILRGWVLKLNILWLF